MCCSVLQHVSALHCVTVCCIDFQCVEVFCSVLQCVRLQMQLSELVVILEICCSVLQSVAVCTIVNANV